jgi:septal ring factor EnvC (AmiA/AmiB activator)
MAQKDIDYRYRNRLQRMQQDYAIQQKSVNQIESDMRKLQDDLARCLREIESIRNVEKEIMFDISREYGSQYKLDPITLKLYVEDDNENSGIKNI